MSGKLHEFRKIGTELSWRRYLGEEIKVTEDILPYDSIECELSNYSSNFIMAGRPIMKEIFIAEKLLEELEKEAIQKDVDLSSLITIYLLKMLEGRNRTTRTKSNCITNGKRTYVGNNLYEFSNFIQYIEGKEEFKKNVFDNEKVKKELTYENIRVDEYIYIQNYLMDKGYSKEQIEELQKEEREKFGTYKSHGDTTMIKPYTVDMESFCTINGKEIKALTHEFKVRVMISARLGMHYVLMHKKTSPKTYEGIEELINRGGYKVWDLYAKFLEIESQKENNPQKAE